MEPKGNSTQASNDMTINQASSLIKSVIYLVSFVLTFALAASDALADDGGDAKKCASVVNSEDGGKEAAPEKAAPKKKPAAKTKKRATATTALTSTADVTKSVAKALPFYEFSDLANLSDDKKNMVLAHPTSVMTAAQQMAQVIKRYDPLVVMDPEYRTTQIKVYPVFTGSEETSEGRIIVGQYEAIEQLVTFVDSMASGDKTDKMLIYVGPAGTGKTETLEIVAKVQGSLMKSEHEFAQFTYEWVNLDQVKQLKRLVPMDAGEPLFDEITSSMGRNPFTLLPASLQQELIEKVADKAQNLTGYKPMAWTLPDPKTTDIIKYIMKAEIEDFKEGKREDENGNLVTYRLEDIPVDEYMKALSKYVRIVQKNPDLNRASTIIRAAPDNPNLDELFISQDIKSMLFYPRQSALPYNFDGKVLRTDGGGFLGDEIFRNDSSVLNTLLELAQNGVVETDTGPAVKMNIVPVMTSNDESIESAAEDGDMKALIDRMHREPVRLNIHPYEIAKIALVMIGSGEEGKFKMRSLFEIDEDGKQTAKRVATARKTPLDINKAFPLPDSDGILKPSTDRYALYYSSGSSDQDILFSPHALELMAFTASATRLVTDQKLLTDHSHELRVLNDRSHYYTSSVARINVLTGKDDVELALRVDLKKVKQLFREGEKGISSRDIQSWMKEAIRIAKKNGSATVTPAVMDTAFQKLINKGTIAPPQGVARADWLAEYSRIKSAFIIPALENDIRMIASGDGKKAERIYDVIAAELTELTEDTTATHFSPDGHSDPKLIDVERLKIVKGIYQQLKGRELSLAPILKGANTADASGPRRDTTLMKAIQVYLSKHDASVSEGADRIAKFYEGKSDNPADEKLANEAEAIMESYGYNMRSYLEAYKFYQSHKRMNPNQ